jgi:tetratricopeptide (TPR) repeat protein
VYEPVYSDRKDNFYKYLKANKMKNSSIYMYLILFFCAANFTSCKKYLDEKPIASILSPNTIGDAQALLDNSSVMNEVVTATYGEASTDDFFLLPNNFNSLSASRQKIYTWVPFDYVIQNDWSKCYFPVYYADLALETIEKIPVTNQNQPERNNVYGSALFYRAYFFTQLVWTYSQAYDETTANTDLGIVLKLQSDFNIKSVRANVKESYDRIIKDAEESILYLPNLPSHSFRPSKASAYGLLARVYLSMRKYDDAYKYANLYLQIKSDLIDCNINNTSDFETPISSVPFKQFNSETIFYTEINSTLPNAVVGTSRAKIDTLLYSSYENNDIRKSAFFTASSGYRKYKGSYAGSGTIFFSGIATDEMYLVKAECIARGLNGNPGDKDAALTALNTLLYKRYDNTFTGLTATDANDALNTILLERRKELIMRGLRWIDIKRLNKEGRNIVLTRILPDGTIVTLLPNANYYALPLPKDIIDQTGMPQNPQ